MGRLKKMAVNLKRCACFLRFWLLCYLWLNEAARNINDDDDCMKTVFRPLHNEHVYSPNSRKTDRTEYIQRSKIC